MRTTRIISNISYNSDFFFASKLLELEKRGIIDWCYWIRHQPDIDERKEHIHFVLKPSKQVDTAKLRNEFLELDPEHPGLPLAPTKRWFFTNSMDDWLLYVTHDAGYLMSKGQRRNICYSIDDLLATDPDGLLADWNQIDRIKYQRLEWLRNAAECRIPFALLVQDGVIPIAQRAQYEAQYNQLVVLYENPEISGRKVEHE